MIFTPQMFSDLTSVQVENADVCFGRELEQEILDILDADAATDP